MQKVYRNIRILFFAVLAVSLYAQDAAPTAPAADTATAVQPGQNTSGLTDFLDSQNLLNLSNNLFNPNSDSVDPENGILQWKGKTFAMDQNYPFRSRFERYLSMPTPGRETYEQYREMFSEVRRLLSIENTNVENRKKAWELLIDASKNQLDDGLSLMIANQVHNAWRVRDESRNRRYAAAELERVRRDQEIIVENRYHRLVQSIKEREQAMGRSASEAGASTGTSSNTSLTNDQNITNDDDSEDSSKGGRSSGDVNSGIGSGSLSGVGQQLGNNASLNAPGSYAPLSGSISEPGFRIRDLGMTEAKINALGAQTMISSTQAKLQFQSRVLSFFLERRFEHVLIAADFYRFIWKASEQEMLVGQKQLDEFFPNADFNITIDTLAQMALEAIADTDKSMSAIENSYQHGDRIVTLKRLQEAFFLGEFLPPVYMLDEEKKRTLLKLYRNMRTAKDLVDIKDYSRAEEVIKEIQEIAKDFESTKILSAIRNAKTVSQYAVASAGLFRNTDEPEKAQAELMKAIEIWPLNPDIKKFQDETFSMVKGTTQGLEDFDRLLEKGSYREIFDRRIELGAALMSAPEKLTELQVIAERIGNIDFLLKKAEEAIAQDMPYEAWEILDSAYEMEPYDMKINKKRADLALRVGDFVQKLDQGLREERKNNYTLSLISYLQAQDIYPVSKRARLGINRVSEKLLEQMAPVMAEPISDLNHDTDKTSIQ